MHFGYVLIIDDAHRWRNLKVSMPLVNLCAKLPDSKLKFIKGMSGAFNGGLPLNSRQGEDGCLALLKDLSYCRGILPRT